MQSRGGWATELTLRYSYLCPGMGYSRRLRRRRRVSDVVLFCGMDTMNRLDDMTCLCADFNGGCEVVCLSRSGSSLGSYLIRREVRISDSSSLCYTFLFPPSLTICICMQLGWDNKARKGGGRTAVILCGRHKKSSGLEGWRRRSGRERRKNEWIFYDGLEMWGFSLILGFIHIYIHAGLGRLGMVV